MSTLAIIIIQWNGEWKAWRDDFLQKKSEIERTLGVRWLAGELQFMEGKLRWATQNVFR